MSDDLWIILPLQPEPWKVGPASAVRRGGKYIPVIGRDNQLHAFKQAVAEQVRDQLGLKQGSPVVFNSKVSLTLFLWRDRPEYATPQARTHRKHEADATNMLKAAEDGLQGVLYTNDKDNREVRAVVVEQDTGIEPRIVIHIKPWLGLDPAEIPDHVWARMDTTQDELNFLTDWHS